MYVCMYVYIYIYSMQKDLLYLAKFYISVEFAFVKTTFKIIASNWDYGFSKECSDNEKLVDTELNC